MRMKCVKKKIPVWCGAFAALALVISLLIAQAAAAEKLETPTLVSLTSEGSGQMTLEWEPVDGADGYYIYRMSGSDIYYLAVYNAEGEASFSSPVYFSKIATVDADETSYTDKTAVDGRVYQYAVEAFNEEGASGRSECLFGHTAFEVPQCWDIRISNKTSRGFDVTASVVSDVKIGHVWMMCWSDRNGQDDLRWEIVNDEGGGVYTAHISTAEHNNETGNYIIHVVPMDTNGKVSEDYGDACRNFADVIVPDSSTKLLNPVLNKVTKDGYQAALTYYTEGKVEKAEAVTWTTKNGKDDILTTEAEIDKENHIIRANILTADHGGKTGEYNTAVVLYTTDGNAVEYDFRVDVGDAEEELAVTHIDVNFGDSTLIESNGEYVLVDCGESDAVYNILQVLKEKNAKAIPVIISHLHSDHAGGLMQLIEEGFVSKIYVDTVGYSDVYFDGRKIEEDLNYAEEKGIPIVEITGLKKLKVGNAEITAIGPTKNYDFTDTGTANNRSVWLKVSGGGKSYLLAGDAERLAEEDMIEDGVDLDVDFIKMSHHGTRSSTSRPYIKATSPEAAFASDNPFHVPMDSPAVLRLQEAGVPVYRTQQIGTILNRSTDGNSIITGMRSKPAELESLGSWIYEGVDYSDEFDPEYYANRYPDLMERYGLDPDKLLRHWVRHGKAEGRKAK